MLKFALIFIVLVGAAFGIPQIRRHVAPPLEPVLGPIGKKFGDPAKKVAARNEAGMLLRKIAEEYNQNKEVPDPLRFPVWVKMNTKGSRKGADPWGKPYYMIKENRQLTIGSAGPDMKRSTSDDIRVSVPFN